MPTLLTIGQIACQLGQRDHRVDYIIKSRQIRPVARAGNMRVFDEAAVEKIRREIELIDRRRELARR